MFYAVEVVKFGSESGHLAFLVIWQGTYFFAVTSPRVHRLYVFVFFDMMRISSSAENVFECV